MKKNMSKEKKEKENHFDRFREGFGLVEALQDASVASSPKEGRAHVRNKAEKTLKTVAGQIYDSPLFGISSAGTILDPRQIKDEKLYGQAVAQMNAAAYEKTATYVANNVAEIAHSMSESALEKLVLSEQFQKLAPADSHGFGDWISKYGAVVNARGLNEKIKDGKKLDDKELQFLRGSVAQEIAKETSENFKKMGYSNAVAKDLGNLSALGIQSGEEDNKYLAKAAESFVKKTAEDLRKYETDKGKDARGYVEKALGKLAKADTSTFNERLLPLLYAVGKE